MIKASVGFELKLHHNFCDDAHIRELDKMYRYIQCLFTSASCIYAKWNEKVNELGEVHTYVKGVLRIILEARYARRWMVWLTCKGGTGH